MKILHITPSTNGYEEAILLKNHVSETNRLAVIDLKGEVFFTGGFLIKDTPKIRQILDSIPKKEQYDFVRYFRITPFIVK